MPKESEVIDTKQSEKLNLITRYLCMVEKRECRILFLLLLSKPQEGISFADCQKESEVIDTKQSRRLIPIFRYLDGFKKGM